jgi:sucrose-6-phosphate hydrolase SacC (GH32 family)
MTLPREYYLTTDADGHYSVTQQFASQIKDKFTHDHPVTESEQSSIEVSGNVYQLSGQLTLCEGQQAGIALFGENCAQLSIGLLKNTIIVSNYRSYTGSNPVMQQEFPHDYSFSKACDAASVTFELIVDNGSAELLLDDGAISVTQLYFPENPAGDVSLSGDGWSQVRLATCEQNIK